ncbi:GNAT family N-acetyltransferase [Nonomuraea sp. NPDC049152]|uniref:GNAT family N-acetyltransferase n=1 Tax=Nonomuraea sp. NPDC049152 TaxID=3154350 RepID=UPI0033C94681
MTHDRNPVQVEEYTDTAEDRVAYGRLSERRLPGWPVMHRSPKQVGAFAFWAVRRDGELLGYADCGEFPGVDDRDAFHVWIVADPDTSERGIGTALLKACREFARKHDRSVLVTSIDQEDAPANVWMVNRGFEVHGESIRYELSTDWPELLGHDLTFTDAADADEATRRRILNMALLTHNRHVFPGGGAWQETMEEVEEAFFEPEQCRVTVGWRGGEPVAWAAWQRDGQKVLVRETCVLMSDEYDQAQTLTEVARSSGAEIMEIVASPQTHPLVTAVIRARDPRVLAVRRTWRGGMTDREPRV